MIFATAYNLDQEFFDFYRSMQSYRAALGSTGTTMVLSPDTEFFQYFGSDQRNGGAGGAASSGGAGEAVANGAAADEPVGPADAPAPMEAVEPEQTEAVPAQPIEAPAAPGQ